MTPSTTAYPSPLLARAKRDAAAAVALVLEVPRTEDLPVLHASLFEQMAHPWHRDALLRRSGLNAKRLSVLRMFVEEALGAGSRSDQGSLELKIDAAIAHLRLVRLCRLLSPDRFVSRPDIAPLLKAGPRVTGLAGSAMALEVLLRQLVRSCHQSEDALQGYLRHRVGVSRVDELVMHQLQALLFDEVHSMHLHPALLQPDVLTLRQSTVETLELYLHDLRQVRNTVAHVRETLLGEECLHLFACEAGKIERLVSRAVAAGLLALPDRPQSLGLEHLFTEQLSLKPEPAATGHVWPEVSSDQVVALRRLQARVADTAAGGQRVQSIPIGHKLLRFCVIPHPGEEGLGWFRMTEESLCTPQGAGLMSSEQVTRLLQRLPTDTLDVRLPTIEELLWALSPYGVRAESNPFGLVQPSLLDAHWVRPVAGSCLLVSLPGGRFDPRGTGRLRLILESGVRRRAQAS